MSHLSKEQIESLSADLEHLGRKETLLHLLLCIHCRRRAAALQLLDEEETWEELPATFGERVLHRAVGILEERCARACEEQAAAEPLRDEPSVGRLYLLGKEPETAVALDDLGTGPCQEKRAIELNVAPRRKVLRTERTTARKAAKTPPAPATPTAK